MASTILCSHTQVIPNDELQWTPDVGSLLSKEPGVNIVEVDLRQVDLDISRPENLRKVFGDRCGHTITRYREFALK